MKTKKLNFSICTLSIMMLLTLQTFAQKYCSSTQKRPLANKNVSNNKDTTFELYKSNRSGKACMNIKNAGKNQKKVNGYWGGKIENVLIRESKRQKPATNDKLSYNISFSQMDNNVYHGAYGWWRGGSGVNGVVEWYIVQGYNSKKNPTYGMTKAKGTYKDAGGTYEVWFKNISNQGSVYSDITSFTQIKCVRTSSVGRKSSKTLNLQKHFNNMISRTRLTKVGTLFESSYCIEGFGANSRAKFKLDAKFSSPSKRSKSASITKEELEATILDTPIHNNPGGNLKVFPNPATDSFTINTGDLKQSNITITNLLGKTVYSKTLENNNLEFVKSNQFDSGMYFITVTDKQNKKHTVKLIIK